MEEESLKTIRQLEKLVAERRPKKQLIKIEEMEKRYGMERTALVRTAKECGCYYQINNISLIDIIVFDPYFTRKYLINDQSEDEANATE